MSASNGTNRTLFAVTILTGSFLLFLIQPMVARMALPQLGGAPNVWNSAMLVYQALLLAGYWYAHRLAQLPFRRQARIHLGLFAIALITLPVGLVALPSPTPGTEVFWVPALLALSIGPVFFLVSAQAPLMQRWYGLHPDSAQPWALYAASNLGSFAGLLAYPVLFEPLLSLRVQAWAWSGGYVLLLGLIVLAARVRWNAPAPPTQSSAARIPLRQLAMWVALAAVPSGLMLSTTTHLTTDIFAMPLLWVIPLGLYLFSFVIAFSNHRGLAQGISTLAWPLLLSIGGLAMVSQGSSGLLPVIASVSLLFFLCVALHARLYDLRPEPVQLTTFYLAMSVGGVLGGLFTALVAPLCFDWVWEHPLLILAAALLVPITPWLDWKRHPGLQPELKYMALGMALLTAAGLLWMLYHARLYDDSESHPVVLAAALAATGLIVVPWRWLTAALLLGVMLVQGGLQTIADSREGVRTRSYFGVYTVRDHPDRNLRTLAHGTTLHGQQSLDPALKCLPLSYYGPGSGVAIGFANASRLYPGLPRIGVVGLGTGSLAGFARPRQSWTLFEIDEAVLDLSRQGKFTYLRDCAPGARVIIGDARINLGRVRPGSFDLLAIDAFSSDSVPLHLLTAEAFGVYFDALAAQGILFVHISNRFMDLEPPIAAEVRRRQLHAAVREDVPPAEGPWTASTWIAISRDPGRVKALSAMAPAMAWRPLGAPARQRWTDDHASILPYVTWANFLGPQ